MLKKDVSVFLFVVVVMFLKAYISSIWLKYHPSNLISKKIQSSSRNRRLIDCRFTQSHVIKLKWVDLHQSARTWNTQSYRLRLAVRCRAQQSVSKLNYRAVITDGNRSSWTDLGNPIWRRPAGSGLARCPPLIVACCSAVSVHGPRWPTTTWP